MYMWRRKEELYRMRLERNCFKGVEKHSNRENGRTQYTNRDNEDIWDQRGTPENHLKNFQKLKEEVGCAAGYAVANQHIPDTQPDVVRSVETNKQRGRGQGR